MRKQLTDKQRNTLVKIILGSVFLLATVICLFIGMRLISTKNWPTATGEVFKVEESEMDTTEIRSRTFITSWLYLDINGRRHIAYVGGDWTVGGYCNVRYDPNQINDEIMHVYEDDPRIEKNGVICLVFAGIFALVVVILVFGKDAYSNTEP